MSCCGLVVYSPDFTLKSPGKLAHRRPVMSDSVRNEPEYLYFLKSFLLHSKPKLRITELASSLSWPSPKPHHTVLLDKACFIPLKWTQLSYSGRALGAHEEKAQVRLGILEDASFSPLCSVPTFGQDPVTYCPILWKFPKECRHFFSTTICS